MTGPRKRIDDQDRAKILELALDGMGNKEIGAKLDIHGQTVNGVVFQGRKRGMLPPLPRSSKNKVVTPLPPPPPLKPIPQPSPDNLTGGRPVIGGPGGFVASMQGMKYTVERLNPPDGLLGTHHEPFSVEQLGEIYGEGQYRVIRHEAGRAVPMEFIQKIGSAYGIPRFTSSRNISASIAPATVAQKMHLERLVEDLRLRTAEADAAFRYALRLLAENDSLRAELARKRHNGHSKSRKRT